MIDISALTEAVDESASDVPGWADVWIGLLYGQEHSDDSEVDDEPWPNSHLHDPPAIVRGLRIVRQVGSSTAIFCSDDDDDDDYDYADEDVSYSSPILFLSHHAVLVALSRPSSSSKFHFCPITSSLFMTSLALRALYKYIQTCFLTPNRFILTYKKFHLGELNFLQCLQQRCLECKALYRTSAELILIKPRRQKNIGLSSKLRPIERCLMKNIRRLHVS